VRRRLQVLIFFNKYAEMETSNYYDDIEVESESVVTTSNASEERITVHIERTIEYPKKLVLLDIFLLDAPLSDNIASIKNRIWLRTGWAPGLDITVFDSPNAYRYQTYRHASLRDIQMPVVTIKNAMTLNA
jgi:hypothetical protein